MALAENVSVHPAVAHRSSSQFMPPARNSRWRFRHTCLMTSFMILVLIPVGLSGWYLWSRAADQYASTLAFSVRSEDAASGLEVLGGIADVSGSGANDSDILYDFLNSQQLVREISRTLDLAAMWAKPSQDWVFAYKPSDKIEDLHTHWLRMIDVSHDATRGIIEVRARGFTSPDATLINEAVLKSATDLINQINNIAREDGVRYALEDLQRAKAQLGTARQDLMRFRIDNEIVDPTSEAEFQATLLASLDAQLTETLIEIEILTANSRAGDVRLQQAQTRADVLTQRIAEERSKRAFGANNSNRQGLAQMFGDYEKLVVDMQFAEERYQAARASFDAALSEARRNTRYLAAHILPTTAEKSLFPERGLIFALIALAAFLVWSLISLIGFSFLDRR